MLGGMPTAMPSSTTYRPWGMPAPGAITATYLADDAVEEEAILDGAVTTDKLGALAVTAAKLAADAVETAKIWMDANVTAAKIATDAVTAAKLAMDAVERRRSGRQRHRGESSQRTSGTPEVRTVPVWRSSWRG